MHLLKHKIILVYLLALSAVANAENYIREYNYQASERDSKASSKDFALKELKRELVEYLGVHIKSEISVHEN